MLYLHRIFNGIWMIDRDSVANFLPLVAAYIKGESPQIRNSDTQPESFFRLAFRDNSKYFISDYGNAASPEDAPADSVAIININGAITKHNQYCGPAGMVTKADILYRCFANDDIKSVVLFVESGGGEAYAMRTFSEAMKSKNKPVVGFIEDYACSAGYGILSHCDYIAANSSLARVGSIGTYQTILDHSGALEKLGVKIHEIYATESTDKNQVFYEALKGNYEPLKKMIDVVNHAFLSQVEDGRSEKLTTDRNVWGTGKVYYADEALKLGLIDEIDTFNNVLNYF